jgi:hypothetical protein
MTDDRQAIFDRISYGLIAQGDKCNRFIRDEEERRDAYGFVADTLADHEYYEHLKDAKFIEINREYLEGEWSDAACYIADLCQQIHDYHDPIDWEYYLKKLAEQEDLEWLIL